MSETLSGDLELESLEARVEEFSRAFWQTQRGFENSKGYFNRFCETLCVKFGEQANLERRVLAVSLTFPRPQHDLREVNAWREQKAYESLLPEFHHLSGLRVQCLLEVMRSHHSQLTVVYQDRELFRFYSEFKGLNTHPRSIWDFKNHLGDSLDPLVGEVSLINHQDPVYQMQAALILILLIYKRGEIDQNSKRWTDLMMYNLHK